MKSITIVGPVDKRSIVYPLLKVLTFSGKTLVLSDDGVYRRFADDFSTDFNKGTMDFCIMPKLCKTSVEAKGHALLSHDFVLWLTTNEVIERDGCVVYTKGLNNSFCSEDIEDFIEGVEAKIVYLTPSPIRDSKLLKVPISKDVLGYIYACEESKDFEVCKSSELAKITSVLFGDVLGLSADAIKKLLLRKE